MSTGASGGGRVVTKATYVRVAIAAGLAAVAVVLLVIAVLSGGSDEQPADAHPAEATTTTSATAKPFTDAEEQYLANVERANYVPDSDRRNLVDAGYMWCAERIPGVDPRNAELYQHIESTYGVEKYQTWRIMADELLCPEG